MHSNLLSSKQIFHWQICRNCPLLAQRLSKFQQVVALNIPTPNTSDAPNDLDCKTELQELHHLNLQSQMEIIHTNRSSPCVCNMAPSSKMPKTDTLQDRKECWSKKRHFHRKPTSIDASLKRMPCTRDLGDAQGHLAAKNGYLTSKIKLQWTGEKTWYAILYPSTQY